MSYEVKDIIRQRINIIEINFEQIIQSNPISGKNILSIFKFGYTENV
jgi:hypothetical protein